MSQANRADDRLLSEHRHDYNAADATLASVRERVRTRLVRLGSPLDVGDPKDTSTPDGAADRGAGRHWPGPLPPPVRELVRRVAGMGDRVDERPVEAIDASIRGAAQSGGIANDSVEHGLHVSLRLTDHLENLGGRRLLLKRLCDSTILLLQLREEPDILDGYDGLVGEGLE